MNAAVWLVLAFSSGLAFAAGNEATPTCEYEENCQCVVPGITLRWKASYCMALNETDDLENEAVQECLATAEPARVAQLEACEQNAHWKKLICGVLHENDNKQVQECVGDRSMIPPFVKFGPGNS